MNTETNWDWTSQSIQTHLENSGNNSPPFIGGHWNDPVPPDCKSIKNDHKGFEIYGTENIYGNLWSYPKPYFSANIFESKKAGIAKRIINKIKKFFRRREKSSD